MHRHESVVMVCYTVRTTDSICLLLSDGNYTARPEIQIDSRATLKRRLYLNHLTQGHALLSVLGCIIPHLFMKKRRCSGLSTHINKLRADLRG